MKTLSRGGEKNWRSGGGVRSFRQLFLDILLWMGTEKWDSGWRWMKYQGRVIETGDAIARRNIKKLEQKAH